ncbi:MAG TPA: hypothetical protein VFX70_16355, partial [Mycobacteriales bacterium]|nr:hypothetical protein [Mycobacteriales bacterium]
GPMHRDFPTSPLPISRNHPDHPGACNGVFEIALDPGQGGVRTSGIMVGGHVIGVGAETATSARPVSVCSEYKRWGSIVARVEPPAETAPPAAQPGFRLADAETVRLLAVPPAVGQSICLFSSRDGCHAMMRYCTPVASPT